MKIHQPFDLEINLSPKYIVKGKPKKCGNCPIALAIWDKINVSNERLLVDKVAVSNFGVSLRNKFNVVMYYAKLPDIVKEAIFDYDNFKLGGAFKSIFMRSLKFTLHFKHSGYYNFDKKELTPELAKQLHEGRVHEGFKFDG